MSNTEHTPGPWEVADYLSRSVSRVFVVCRWTGPGAVHEYLRTPAGKVRRFRSYEAARAAMAKAGEASSAEAS